MIACADRAWKFTVLMEIYTAFRDHRCMTVLNFNMQPSGGCFLCACEPREYLRVPHYDSKGLPLHEEIFCADCWASWQNIRQNLDGANEYGVQCMTCPHCQKPLTDEDVMYAKVQPQLYEVTVDGLAFMVTVDTRTENFKKSIWWSTVATPYEGHEEFDLAVDDSVLTGPYLCIGAGSSIKVVPRKKATVSMLIYPSRDTTRLEVYESSTFDELKQVLQRQGHREIVFFHAQTRVEYAGSRTIASYSDLETIAVMPRYLYDALRPTIYTVDTVLIYIE